MRQRRVVHIGRRVEYFGPVRIVQEHIQVRRSGSQLVYTVHVQHGNTLQPIASSVDNHLIMNRIDAWLGISVRQGILARKCRTVPKIPVVLKSRLTVRGNVIRKNNRRRVAAGKVRHRESIGHTDFGGDVQAHRESGLPGEEQDGRFHPYREQKRVGQGGRTADFDAAVGLAAHFKDELIGLPVQASGQAFHRQDLNLRNSQTRRRGTVHCGDGRRRLGHPEGNVLIIDRALQAIGNIGQVNRILG